jgi:hypothetical protein
MDPTMPVVDHAVRHTGIRGTKPAASAGCLRLGSGLGSFNKRQVSMCANRPKAPKKSTIISKAKRL